MKKKDSFPLVTKIFGIIITAWITFLVAIELIKALKEGIESFFYNIITKTISETKCLMKKVSLGIS